MNIEIYIDTATKTTLPPQPLLRLSINRSRLNAYVEKKCRKCGQNVAKNAHVNAICSRTEVADVVISGGNVKTIQG